MFDRTLAKLTEVIPIYNIRCKEIVVKGENHLLPLHTQIIFVMLS